MAPSPRFLEKTLLETREGDFLEVARDISHSFASCAMRSIMTAAKSPRVRDIRIENGQLLCRPEAFAAYTNAEVKNGGDLPFLHSIFEKSSGVRDHLLIFRKRGAWLARQDSEGQPARILPIIFKISARPIHGHVLAPRISGNREKSRLMVRRSTPHESARQFPLAGTDKTEARGRIFVRKLFIDHLAQDCSAWLDKLPALPRLHDPSDCAGPPQGVLGTDIPATDPESAGHPYWWPSIFARHAVSRENYEKDRIFYKYALISILDEIRDWATYFSLIVRSRPPAFGKLPAKSVAIEARVVPGPAAVVAGATGKDVERWICDLYRVAMKSPRFPDHLRRNYAVRVSPTGPHPARGPIGDLRTCSFFSYTSTDPISWHERIEARKALGPLSLPDPPARPS